jgi:hypothetical protein
LKHVTRVANVILGGSGLFCVILLAYLVYTYTWTDKAAFASVRGMLLYYGLPALLAVVCFALLRLPPEHRISVALLLFSTGASVYIGEAVMSVWFSLPSVKAEMGKRERAQTARAMGIEFDTRTKLEVAAELRKKGIEAYPVSAPRALLEEQRDGTLKSKLVLRTEVLPLGWISNHLSILCNESGTFVAYESDELGFHNPRGLWHNDKIEIVALGDSYAQGYCVPSDKNFVALVRKQYPATLNLGVAGHGPLLMLATLKEYGQLVKPRVVLWFHYEGNDLRDLGIERNSPLLMRYMEDGFRQGLIEQQADIDRALMTYIEGIQETSRTSQRVAELVELFENPRNLLSRARDILRLSQLRRQLGLVYGKGGEAADEDGQRSPSGGQIELFSKSLQEAHGSVSAWGGTLYFVYLPHWHRYARPRDAEKSRDRVLQTVSAMGLPIIDIHEVFRAQPDPLALFPFRRHSHYNEAGHRLVAEHVLQSVDVR